MTTIRTAGSLEPYADLAVKRNVDAGIVPGPRADLVIVKGNPEQQIKDVEQVELVFKDGAGYDPQKLIGSVTGTVGLH